MVRLWMPSANDTLSCGQIHNHDTKFVFVFVEIILVKSTDIFQFPFLEFIPPLYCRYLHLRLRWYEIRLKTHQDDIIKDRLT